MILSENVTSGKPQTRAEPWTHRMLAHPPRTRFAGLRWPQRLGGRDHRGRPQGWAGAEAPFGKAGFRNLPFSSHPSNVQPSEDRRMTMRERVRNQLFQGRFSARPMWTTPMVPAPQTLRPQPSSEAGAGRMRSLPCRAISKLLQFHRIVICIRWVQGYALAQPWRRRDS